MADIGQRSESTPSGRQRSSRNIDRNAKLPLEDSCTLNVINMVVRYDHTLHVANVAAMFGHPPCRAASAYAGIEQKPGVGGFDVDTVTVGPGLHGKGLHGGMIPNAYCSSQLDDTLRL